MDLTALINRYKSLGIDDVIDHEKFNLISKHSSVLRWQWPHIQAADELYPGLL
jgi:hypothetical protein